jgi:hypothetical protein
VAQNRDKWRAPVNTLQMFELLKRLVICLPAERLSDSHAGLLSMGLVITN